MLFELNQEILKEFLSLKQTGNSPSQILRKIFSKFGEVSPPIMADYFEEVYEVHAMDFMPALGAWWHDSSTEITDKEFDQRINRMISKNKKTEKTTKK